MRSEKDVGMEDLEGRKVEILLTHTVYKKLRVAGQS
jgi:hypothetical protein